MRRHLIPLLAASTAAIAISTIPSTSYPTQNVSARPAAPPIARYRPEPLEGNTAAPTTTVVPSTTTSTAPVVTVPPQTVPPSRPVQVTTGAPTVSGSSGTWQCIIAHESGGDPTAVNSSSGAAGLVQFMPSTWHAMGMSGTASDYPADVQMAVAYRLQASAGWSPWVGDHCTPLG